jgi:hypothetical protein
MGGGRHSRRYSGSSSGARFVVASIPPFRASRRGSDTSVAGAASSAEAAPVVLEPRNESLGPVFGITSLVKVREDIGKHGGIPGQVISYVGTALAEA